MTLLTNADVERAIDVRAKAQRAGDKALADSTRRSLAALGIELADGNHGTTWWRAARRKSDG